MSTPVPDTGLIRRDQAVVAHGPRGRWRALLAGLLALVLAVECLAGGEKVTPEQLQRVHQAFQEAKKAGFTPEAMIRLYSLPDVPNVAGAVKKLVDLNQSRPDFCISAADSQAMESTRQAMNMRVLQELAALTGGSIEVMDAGKQNGIRSDKDLMIFAVLDGKRPVSATEMKRLYEKHWKRLYGQPLDRFDMSIFDGDAMIPDWRKTSMSLAEYTEKFKKGQAKLEQNPEAVREAGTWRQGAELRYATNSRVTLVKHLPDPEDPRGLTGLDTQQEVRTVTDATGQKLHFAVIEEAPVGKASQRYQEWTADLPYRNAMDAAFEWWQRHNHSNDFIDRMKYFNRTVGDGINALAMDDWDVQYIFHLARLPGAQERQAFIRRMVDQVYVVDLSAEAREHFTKVIAMSAEIEVDKMLGRSRPEAEYLKPIIEVVARDLKKDAGDPAVLEAARQRLSSWQQDIMRHNLAATARQKLHLDLGDPKRAALLAAKYADPARGHDGWEEVKKLRWESWRQIGRIIDQLDDDKLVRRIIADAPEALRPRLSALHEVAQFNRELQKRTPRLELAESDPRKAREAAPEERTLVKKAQADVEAKETRVQQLLDRLGKQWDDFKADYRAGEYTDEAITRHLQAQLLDNLGFEDRAVLKKLQVEYELKFSGSKLLRNMVNLGNVNSVLNVLQVYQQTGDWNAVVQTAVWELVSNVPGVSQVATLKQAFNDGNVEGLAWLFIAYEIPAAGQVKMVFDAAKGTVTLLYNHAMDPLKEDRFSQVYLGYIDAQAAGWSPFKPGWKERRAAAADSILHFVPGDTFEEKRSNMHAFFHARLDAKLQAAGLKPTADGYWEKYETVKEPFFRKYVHDYFNAADEWKDNTTVGLKAVGELEGLKDRLVKQLLRDFEQGRRNDERMEEVRMKMEEALRKTEEVARRNLEAERRLLALREAVSRGAARDIVAQMKKPEAPAPGRTALVRAMAFPPTVAEDQQATILVRAIGLSDGQAPDQAHVVEVRRVDAAHPPTTTAPAAAAKAAPGRAISAEEAARQLGDDAPLVGPLLEDKDAARKRYRVARVDYEVTVKSPGGQVLDRQLVSVNLAGAEAPSGDENLVLKLRYWVPDPPATQPARGGLHMQSYTSHIVDYDPARVTPYNVSPQASMFPNFGGHALLLWVRWAQAPLEKACYFDLRTHGGTPAFDKSAAGQVSGWTLFQPASGQFVPGNCFVLAPQFPVASIGSFTIEGTLSAYDKPYRDAAERKSAQPLASMPISISFEVPHPPQTASGKGNLYNSGNLSGSITITNVQSGRRPARISFGGQAIWTMLNAGSGPDATLYFPEARGITRADTATISYMDWGRMVTLQAPLEVKYPAKPAAEPDAALVASRLKSIAEYQKTEEARLEDIARTYGSLAYMLEGGGLAYRDYETWKGYRQKQLAYLDRAIAAAGNPDSALARTLGSTPADRVKFGKARQQRLADEVMSAIMYATTVAKYTEDIAAAREWAARLEKIIPDLAPDRTREGWYTLEGVYRRLAEMAFRLTGDPSAAQPWWNKAHEARVKRAEGPAIPTRDPLPWQIDEAFRK